MAELEHSIGNELEQTALKHAGRLLRHYSFDLGGQSVQGLLLGWLVDYPAAWIRLAVVEALYQGRYKAISVAQILQIWKRRQQPSPHFSYEFERLVGDRFPRDLLAAQRNSQPNGQSNGQLNSQPNPPQQGASQPRLRPDETTWMEMARQAYEDAGEVTDRLDRPVPEVRVAVESSLDSPAARGSAKPAVALVQEILAVLDEGQILDPWEAESEPTAPFQEGLGLDSSLPVVPMGVVNSVAQVPSQDGDDRSTLLAAGQTIHQFQPEDVNPEFCSKLKAVAEQALADSPPETPPLERETLPAEP